MSTISADGIHGPFSALPVWARVDISAWEYIDDEQVGSHLPRWLEYRHQGQKHRWLFKTRKQRVDGQENYDDYTEVVAYLLARHLGIPAAEARLAQYCPPGAGAPLLGVILKSVSRPGYLWLTGAEHLASLGRPVNRETREGHTLEAILGSLSGLSAPQSAFFPESDAPGVFMAYLLLDALIGNQDRHEENWAIEASQSDPGVKCLAPSYDHGASLGFNLAEEKLHSMLQDGRVASFAHKGKTKRFYLPHVSKRVGLFDVIRIAANLHSSPKAVTSALAAAVAPLIGQNLMELFELSSSGMSQVRATFIVQLINENLRRFADDFAPRP